MSCIAVVFEGVLADGANRPIMPVVARVKQALAEGHTVWILTSWIAADQPDHVGQSAAIAAWSLQHLGRRLDVTPYRLARFDEIWDNKAVRVERGAAGFTMGSLWDRLRVEVEPIGCPACGGQNALQGAGRHGPRIPDDVCKDCNGSGWKVPPT